MVLEFRYIIKFTIDNLLPPLANVFWEWYINEKNCPGTIEIINFLLTVIETKMHFNIISGDFLCENQNFFSTFYRGPIFTEIYDV